MGEQWRDRAEELERERLLWEHQVAALRALTGKNSDVHSYVARTPHFERSPAESPSCDRRILEDPAMSSTTPTSPTFTVSASSTASGHATAFEEIVESAGEAASEAEKQRRDRLWQELIAPLKHYSARLQQRCEEELCARRSAELQTAE